ncbi:cytokine inducing-glycoprotein [Purpureocillium lilacinum]|uniref:Cytokine inducing-glycoprotein n=1 Tax=Purpureocillium lilacinum TaxID=33203 RepID=A0A179GHW6_PURLI|nr:cytokine inducing-glycoprotein [Purpureocillium lilacinum]
MAREPPCGSRAPSANRTKFPLTGGAISLTGQDDYYKTRISISYSNDPKSNTDFSPLVDSADIHDLDPGHTCVKIPDAPPRVVAGANATLQITYKADWDAPHLQTFYACADITYVAAADFNLRIPCFNHTVPGEDNEAAAKSVGATSKQSAADNPEPSASAIVGHGQQMGGAAMAGAIVGSLGGASALVAMAILHRRKKQKERSLRLARMEENARREAYPGDKPAP